MHVGKGLRTWADNPRKQASADGFDPGAFGVGSKAQLRMVCGICQLAGGLWRAISKLDALVSPKLCFNFG